MNQVMINAIELQLLQDELKHLRKENLQLKELLASERDYVKLLKAEVAWAERGYTRKGDVNE
jgi:DNA gyrase/topoisomerase IV subunit A